MAKKLFYRAALLKPRDVFDLVAALQVFPNAVERAIEAAAPRRDLQLARLRELAREAKPDLSTDILPLSNFGRLVPAMIGTAIGLIEGDPGDSRR